MLIKKIFSLFKGIVCLILGIIGILLPVLPGIPFIVIAIILIAPEKGKSLVSWLKSKLK